jgi:hypothetical protein
VPATTVATTSNAQPGDTTVTTNVSAATSRPASSQFTAVGTASLAIALGATTLGTSTLGAASLTATAQRSNRRSCTSTKPMPPALATPFARNSATAATRRTAASHFAAHSAAAHAASAALPAASTLVALFTRTARAPACGAQRVLWVQLLEVRHAFVK